MKIAQVNKRVRDRKHDKNSRVNKWSKEKEKKKQ